MSRFLSKVELEKLPIPESVLAKKSNVVIKDGVKIVGGKTQVYFREATPPAGIGGRLPPVLLLHDRWLTSRTWLKLGTISLLAAAGHRTLALDLPGYGDSPTSDVDDKASFLQSLLLAFDLKNPVVISPTVSGDYTMPYLVKHWINLTGLVVISPYGVMVLEELKTLEDSEKLNKVHPSLKSFLSHPIPDLNYIKTPTLVVFGQHDRSRVSAVLSLLPDSLGHEIPNGSQRPYLDNPPLFHQLLFNFLQALQGEK